MQIVRYIFLLGILFLICFVSFMIWNLSSDESTSDELQISPPSSPSSSSSFSSSYVTNEFSSDNYTSPHTLCLIVPFREAFDELFEFIPYISKFLNKQSIKFYINVINQADTYGFNRGAIINAGFKLISKLHPDCDYVAIHDVDLLPLHDQISYAYPGDDAFHVTPRELHPLGESYSEYYTGGILIISNSQFIRINGLTNQVWGWGLEDQDLAIRLRENYITINRTNGRKLNIDRTNAFKHIHSVNRKRNIRLLCKTQMTTMLNLDRKSEIRDVNFNTVSTHSSTIDTFPFTVFNVNLLCDLRFTPWCNFDC